QRPTRTGRRPACRQRVGLRSRRSADRPRLRQQWPGSAPTPPCLMTRAIVTIGNFDGVHLGHLKLIDQVVSRARALDVRSFAITFDPHPEQVLVPERKLTYLSTADERKEILEQSGIDSVWICPFTRELARLEPEEFMHLVTERQPIAELWVGADFGLGRGRK